MFINEGRLFKNGDIKSDPNTEKKKQTVPGQLHYWLELVRISCGKVIHFSDIIDLCIANRNGKPKVCTVILLYFPLHFKVECVFLNSPVT